MYRLQNNIEIVSGAKHFCIYDFNTEKMYSIDKDGIDVLEKVLNSEERDLSSEEAELAQYLINEGILVKEDNLLEEIQPQEYKMSVDFAWIEITQNCNLICRHCYEGSTRCEKKPEMSVDNFKRVINELETMGVDSIQLVGGEPLMHSQIEQLIGYVVGKFSYIEIYTNGILLTERLLDIIEKNKITIALSMYSEDDKIHDYVTRTPGSLNLTKKHIQQALDKGISIRVASVEMKGVPQFKLTSFEAPFRSDLPRLTGRADLSLYTRDMLRRKLITKKTFSRPIGIQEFYKNKSIHNCFGERLYVDYELNLYPCAMERRVNYGNLLDKPLKALVHNKYAEITKDKIRGCKDCEYRYACYDCRCDSNSQTIDAKPWYCTYDHENGVWINEEEFIDNLLKDK